MSAGRRRPGRHPAAALLLLGVIFLGVGVLLRLQDVDDRTLVAEDLGDVPGSSATSTRPLADAIPVLSGLDELVPRPGGPIPGVDGVLDIPQPTAGPNVAAPTAAVQGLGGPDAVIGPGDPAPVDAGSRTSAAGEPVPQLRDPTFTPVSRRPSPRPLPSPQPPLAAQQPGLVSALYPLPEPTTAARAPLTPVRLELPARAVTAPVDPVGTTPGGGMVVPDQVRTVGWWAPGVLPGGAAGSAVIAGHVDSRTGGIGVLSVLPQLTEGEPVLIGDPSGRTVAFRVAARREYRKYDLPRDVFRRDGPPQLVLITCGGVFDPVARSYESNIVVYAVPA